MSRAALYYRDGKHDFEFPYHKMEFDSVSCVSMRSLCVRELVLVTACRFRNCNSAQTLLVTLLPCGFMDLDTLFKCLQSQAINIMLVA